MMPFQVRKALARKRMQRMLARIRVIPAFTVGLMAAVCPAVAAVAADGAAGGSVSEGVSSAAPAGGMLEAVLFYSIAAAIAVCALGVCISKNIVRMAVWLFGALGAVAMLYFLLAADFLACIQLIVYAGGTLVLLVFGVMLTSRSPWARFEPRKLEVMGAGVVCAALLACLCMILYRSVWNGAEGLVPGASVKEIGTVLLTTYVVPFEIAGVLLMIVMVGAAHMARQEE